MKTNPRKKSRFIWNMWFFLSACLLLSSISFVLLNIQEQRTAQKASAQLLKFIEQDIPTQAVSTTSTQDSVSSDERSELWSSWKIDGILSIPDLELRLPVLSDYSEDRLKISVCIYEKDGGDEPKRQIIAGHNYKSHFGKLSELTIGSNVYYDSLDRVQNTYQVTEILEISPDERETLESGEWDMTLLTCNWNMSRRILVRLDLVEKA